MVSTGMDDHVLVANHLSMQSTTQVNSTWQSLPG